MPLRTVDEPEWLLQLLLPIEEQQELLWRDPLPTSQQTLRRIERYKFPDRADHEAHHKIFGDAVPDARRPADPEKTTADLEKSAGPNAQTCGDSCVSAGELSYGRLGSSWGLTQRVGWVGKWLACFYVKEENMRNPWILTHSLLDLQWYDSRSRIRGPDASDVASLKRGFLGGKFRDQYTSPISIPRKSNSSPLKIGNPKRKGSSSNHHFSGASC